MMRLTREAIFEATYWVLLLLRPLLKIEFAVLSPRVGHLVGGTELWLRKETFKERSWRNPAVFVAGEVANRQYVEMLARRVPVVRNRWLASLLINVAQRHPRAPFLFTAHSAMDDGGQYSAFHLWTHCEPQLSFTRAERVAGEKLLESLGIPRGAPYVCFLAREGTYLDAAFPRGTDAYAYHDYRDSDIGNYLFAAETLSRLGIVCVRMGAVIQSPIEPPNAMVVDYASRCRSDLGDVFLMAHCKFYLGDTAGFCIVAEAFNRPCAYANLVPMGRPPYSERDLFIPKVLRDGATGRALPLREICAIGADRWVSSADYQRAGLLVVENTAEEIAALAVELNDRIDGRWKNDEDDEDLQRRFWSCSPPDWPARRFPVRMGTQFLRAHQELLGKTPIGIDLGRSADGALAH